VDPHKGAFWKFLFSAISLCWGRLFACAQTKSPHEAMLHEDESIAVPPQLPRTGPLSKHGADWRDAQAFITDATPSPSTGAVHRFFKAKLTGCNSPLQSCRLAPPTTLWEDLRHRILVPGHCLFYIYIQCQHITNKSFCQEKGENCVKTNYKDPFVFTLCEAQHQKKNVVYSCSSRFKTRIKSCGGSQRKVTCSPLAGCTKEISPAWRHCP